MAYGPGSGTLAGMDQVDNRPTSRYHDAIMMADVPEALHRTTVALTPDQHEWLRRKSFEQRKSIALLIREVLEEARRRDEPQERLPL